MASEIDPDCHLLALPAEIRTYIFNLTVVEDKPIAISWVPPFVTEPGFLATNRQIRAEAMPIFYGNNIFSATHEWTVINWLRHLDTSQASHIQSIRAFKYSLFPYDSPLDWVRYVQCYGAELVEVCGERSVRRAAILVELPMAENGDTEWAPYDKLDQKDF